MGLPLSVAYIPSPRHLWEKLMMMSIGDIFGVRDGGLCPHPLYVMDPCLT